MKFVFQVCGNWALWILHDHDNEPFPENFKKNNCSIFFFSKMCQRWKSACRWKTCTPAFYFAVEHIIIKPSSFYCICKVSCYNWLSQLFMLFSSLLGPLHYKTTPKKHLFCPCHVVCTVSLKMVEAFPLKLSPVMKKWSLWWSHIIFVTLTFFKGCNLIGQFSLPSEIKNFALPFCLHAISQTWLKPSDCQNFKI